MDNEFNLRKMKARAHAMSRRDSGGSAFFNPFRRITYGIPNRARTMSAAEEGRANGKVDGSELTPSTSAPGRLPPAEHVSRNSKELEGDHGEQNEVFESQATTVGNDVGSNASVRHRGGPGDAALDAETTTEEEKPKKKKKDGRFFKHLEPATPFTPWNQVQRVFFCSPINILLLAAPAGIALHFLNYDGRVVFGVNFVAIVPLAAMLSNATEEIAMRTGEVLGGLINASFGNAVELIVAIIALTQNQIKVVQTSLVGSILSNLLLVLGFCFFCGGVNRREQFFNTTVAQTAASLLALAVGSLIVPTVFAHTDDFNAGEIQLSSDAVPSISHGVALILLIVYASYLFFQMKTHVKLFNEESQKVPSKKIFGKKLPENAVASGIARAGATNAGVRDENGKLGEMMMNPLGHTDEEEEEGPQLSFIVAFATLIGATVIIALCAEGMVGGIEAITSSGAVSEEFVGLILLPIVGNACEHATAVTVAIKDKMDLAIGVAIGSSMQVALLLIPVLVIIGWGMGNQDMTLAFDTFQIIVLFVSVLLVNYLIGDGKSHWLEGLILICLYAIIATCAWFYPVIPEVAG